MSNLGQHVFEIESGDFAIHERLPNTGETLRERIDVHDKHYARIMPYFLAYLMPFRTAAEKRTVAPWPGRGSADWGCTRSSGAATAAIRTTRSASVAARNARSSRRAGCSRGSGPSDDRRQLTGDLRSERMPVRDGRICDLNPPADRQR